MRLRPEERSRFLATAIGLGILLSGLLVAPFVLLAEPPGKRKEPGLAAKVDDQVITLHELEQAAALQLARLEEQKYQLMQSKLEELIEESLLAREAKRRGVSPDALLKAEVFSKVPEVTDTEVGTFMTQNKARLQGESAEIRSRVRDYLRDQKAAQQRRAYVTSLEQRAKVERFLQEPEPIRIPVKAEGAFAEGPKDAPVTLVEFSDFQ